MKIASVVVGPFQENTWLLLDDTVGKAVLIDPGDEPDNVLNLLEQSGADLEAIWITHGHLDHIGAIAGVKRQFDVPVYLHEADLALYTTLAVQAAKMYGVPFEPPPPPDRTLAEGDKVSVGSLTFDVWHLPGHAPGHVAFIGNGVMFGGDTLFAGSIGRTDLPLSDGAAMRRSLERIATLPPGLTVLPGHGPETTIGDELESNPFLTGIARPLSR